MTNVKVIPCDDIVGYMKARSNQARMQWAEMVNGVHAMHKPSNALHMLKVLSEYKAKNDSGLKFQIVEPVLGHDAIVLIRHGDKYVSLCFKFHPKADLNYADEPQGCDAIGKTLTSLLLMASEGRIGAFDVWNSVVKDWACDTDRMNVIRVLD